MNVLWCKGIDELIKNALGDSDFYFEVEKESLFKKYEIRTICVIQLL
ncbi:MAG: hypothetical protein QXR27_04660 [Archaeoglobaceae archaeon]